MAKGLGRSSSSNSNSASAAATSPLHNVIRHAAVPAGGAAVSKPPPVDVNDPKWHEHQSCCGRVQTACGLRFPWLNRPWERACFLVLLLGLLALFSYNIYVAVLKYQRSQNRPVQSLSFRALNAFPAFEIGICPMNPSFGGFNRLTCTVTKINPATGDLDNVTVTPCEATLTVVGGYRCALVPMTLYSAAVSSQVERARTIFALEGVLDICAGNPLACPFANAVMTIAPSGVLVPAISYISSLTSGLTAVELITRFGQATILPTTFVSFATLTASTTVTLKKEERQVIRIALSSVAPVEPTAAISFRLTINSLSLDLVESLATEQVTYDGFDVFASISAIASACTAVLAFVFPTRAMVPRHFFLRPKFRKQSVLPTTALGIMTGMVGAAATKRTDEEAGQGSDTAHAEYDTDGHTEVSHSSASKSTSGS